MPVGLQSISVTQSSRDARRQLADILAGAVAHLMGAVWKVREPDQFARALFRAGVMELVSRRLGPELDPSSSPHLCERTELRWAGFTGAMSKAPAPAAEQAGSARDETRLQDSTGPGCPRVLGAELVAVKTSATPRFIAFARDGQRNREGGDGDGGDEHDDEEFAEREPTPIADPVTNSAQHGDDGRSGRLRTRIPPYGRCGV